MGATTRPYVFGFLLDYVPHSDNVAALLQCKYEWFHVECLPKGQAENAANEEYWYCDECRAEMARVRRRGGRR